MKLTKEQTERLASVDEWAKKLFPNCKLETGLKYARWVVLDAEPDEHSFSMILPDNYFGEMCCSKRIYVLMFIPVF